MEHTLIYSWYNIRNVSVVINPLWSFIKTCSDRFEDHTYSVESSFILNQEGITPNLLCKNFWSNKSKMLKHILAELFSHSILTLYTHGIRIIWKHYS